MFNKPTILISGGAGYIGSHTALALSQNGFYPVVVDNLSTSSSRTAEKFGSFEFGNVGDREFIKHVCGKYKPAAAIHFAAYIQVGESEKDPVKYYKNNTYAAQRFFNTLRLNGVNRVVFSSTAAVYGNASDEPLVETQELRPTSHYGWSKLHAEEYLRSLDHVNSVTLRYFNAAGAASAVHGIGEAHPLPESHLIPLAVFAALDPGQKLSVFGTDYPTPDGTAVRDYIHVLDLAAAHILAVRHLSGGGETEICNLGTGTGNSVLQVIGAVEKSTGKEVKKEFGPRRPGDPNRLVANASHAREVLGWKPQHDLNDIVNSAVKWHRSKHYRKFAKGKLDLA